ncbi:g10815 [Coccomyxa elongata]
MKEIIALRQEEELLRQKEGLLREAQLLDMQLLSGKRGREEDTTDVMQRPQKILNSGDIVCWLVDKFGSQLRQVHSEPLPGARRKGKLQGKAKLREWLDNGREKCLWALRNAMFSQHKLSAHEEEMPDLLLQALHSLAGMRKERTYHFFLLLRVTDQRTPLKVLEPDAKIGTAMRVLYSALSSLDIDAPHMQYEGFASSIDEDATWLLQFMSVIVHYMNHNMLGELTTLVVPLTASTQYEAVDLIHLPQFTAGQSLAVQLGLPVLSLADRMHIVKSQCVRVAKANGRLAAEKLPDAVVDCLAMVGGLPRLLSYLMEAIAGDGDSWKLDFDQRVQRVNAWRVKSLLEKAQNKGLEQVLWWCSLNKRDIAFKKECLLRVVTIMLTDEAVKRTDPLLASSANCPTVGDWEAYGLVQCEVQGAEVVPNDAEGLQETGAISSAACSSATPTPQHAALQSRALSSGAEVGSSGTDNERERRLLDAWQDNGRGRHAASVRLSVSPLALLYMLKELGLMDPSELSVVSSHVARESPADEEVVDAMMLVVNLEAYAACGTDKVSLPELLRGLRIPVPAAGKRFLVPCGHLTVAPEGRHQASRLQPQQVAAKIEECRKEILRSRSTAAGSGAGQEDWPTVTIGFVGVGNRGEDSLVVLVDESEEAWPVIIQSKQTTQQKYETVRGVLDNLQRDLSGTFDLPQVQPDAWAEWQEKPWAKNEEPPAVACEQPGSHLQRAAQVHEAAVDSTLLSFERVLYVYVSDGAFTSTQDRIFRQVLSAGHPWLMHVTVVSYREAACYYTRIGDLKRSILRKAGRGVPAGWERTAAGPGTETVTSKERMESMPWTTRGGCLRKNPAMCRGPAHRALAGLTGANQDPNDQCIGAFTSTIKSITIIM